MRAWHGVDLHPHTVVGGTGIFHAALFNVRYRNQVVLGAAGKITTPGTDQNAILMQPMKAVAFATRGHVAIINPNVIQAGVGFLATHHCNIYRPRVEVCVVGGFLGFNRRNGEVGDPDPYTLAPYGNTAIDVTGGSFEEHIVGFYLGSGSGHIRSSFFAAGNLLNRPDIYSSAAIVDHASTMRLSGNRYSANYRAASVVRLAQSKSTVADQTRVVDLRQARPPARVTKSIRVAAGQTSSHVAFDRAIDHRSVGPAGRRAVKPKGGITVSDDAGSRAAPGTYYYFLYFDAPHGVVRSSSSRRWHGPYQVTIGGNQSVTINLSAAPFHALTDPSKGRYIVGRGKSPTRPDGLWFVPFAARRFVDDFTEPFDVELGTAAASLGREPLIHWQLGTKVAAESIEDYSVIVEPSWKTGFAIRNKTATGFDIDYDAPGSPRRLIITVVPSASGRSGGHLKATSPN